MIKKTKPSLLIIGQGIAGSLLAWLCHWRGIDITLVDRPNPISASRIAGGIINPIIGQRFTVHPDFIQQWPNALQFYHTLSQLAQISSLITLIPVVRLLKKDSIQPCMDQLKKDCPFETIKHPAKYWPGILDPLGSIETSAAICHLQKFLDLTKKTFCHTDRFVESNISTEDITFTKTHVSWQGDKYEHVIWCDGYQAHQHNLWSWLPFHSVKGEILHIGKPEKIKTAIFIHGQWIAPQSDQDWVAGSTYEHDKLNDQPTLSGQEWILKGLENILESRPHLTKHLAGVRPVLRDRRPILGQHPHLSRCWIMNGLGSRGSVAGPWLANMLLDRIIKNIPLRHDLDIQRFQKEFNEAHP